MVIIEILIIAGLIVLNGYFSMSEIALLSVKRSRLISLSRQGDERAKNALYLVRNSSEMLSTIQVAITVIGIFTGAFGGVTVAEYLELWLNNFPIISPYSEAISVFIVVSILTYFALVVGELVPKQIALANAEKFSLKVAGQIMWIMKITAPLVKVLSLSTKGLIKLLRINSKAKNIVTEEEIKLLIAEGVKMGTFEQTEFKMVQNIFHLGNRPIRDFITPNNEVAWIKANDSILTVKEKIRLSDNTVYPVYRESINKPLGAIETNDILTHLVSLGPDKIDLEPLIQPIMYIKGNVPSLVAINRLKKASVKIVLVKDEHSEKILGVLSFHDILEAIVGEFNIKEQ